MSTLLYVSRAAEIPLWKLGAGKCLTRCEPTLVTALAWAGSLQGPLDGLFLWAQAPFGGAHFRHLSRPTSAQSAVISSNQKLRTFPELFLQTTDVATVSPPPPTSSHTQYEEAFAETRGGPEVIVESLYCTPEGPSPGETMLTWQHRD